MPAIPPSDRRGSVRRYNDDAMNRLYHQVWCGRVHFGLWLQPDDTIEAAAERVPLTLAEKIGLSHEDRVLEVGSGAARSMIDLARNFGCDIMATNHSPGHASLATKAIEAEDLGGKIETGLADAHNLPFHDEAFSVYWAQEVLVHLTDKHRCLREARRVLAPGGRIVFTEQTTTPDRMTKSERTQVAQRHGSDDLWGADEFAQAMEDAGFAQIETIDWSSHLARHFAALLERIGKIRLDLNAICGAALVEEQEAVWQDALAFAANGTIGWHLFIGRND